VQYADQPQALAPRLGARPLLALDVVAAAAYLAMAIPLAAAADSPLPRWARVVVTAAVGLPVVFRRRWPLPMLGVVLAASAVAVGAGTMRDPLLAAVFVLYLVALGQPRHRWLPTAAIGIVSALSLVLMSMGSTAPSQPRAGLDPRLTVLALGLALLGGSWTVGRAVRDRRMFQARAAAEMAERAVAEERLRIAREMHDVVAHAMGVIAVKAGVANHVVRERPAEAGEALRVIESTSRDALGEMRALLGVLRNGDTAQLAPTPGIAGLTELVDRAALVGVPVELTVRGGDDVPEGVGLSVYRIVQEAITNVVRHAAPARCQVLVDAADHQVRVEVTDDGPGVRALPGPGGGHGLAGMRERAGAYGGTLRAGPRPEGGFAVRAELPYGEQP
jgi:signal transduction histidine kinase